MTGWTSAELRPVLGLWAQRLGAMAGARLEVRPSVPVRVTAWARARAADGTRVWWGMSRPHAVTLAAGYLRWPRERYEAHLASDEAPALLVDAYGELANVALAALDEHVGAGGRRPCLRLVEARLRDLPPAAMSVLAAKVALPGLAWGAVMVHVGR